jgi:hypothetical protein
MIVASHLPIHEGDNVALQCVETPKGKGVNVLRWELNDSPVDLCGGARILPPGTYSKFIKNNAGMEDRGVYKCIAEIEGKVQRANQTISILPAGIVMYPTRNTTAVIGTNVTLHCRGENYRFILWSKDGVAIKTGGPFTELFISNVTWADNGTYTCTYFAKHPIHGNQKSSQTVELIVIPSSVMTTASAKASTTSTSRPSSTPMNTTLDTAPITTETDATYLVSSDPTTDSEPLPRTDRYLTSHPLPDCCPSTSSNVISASSQDSKKLSSWLMAALVICSAFGILGLTVAVVSLCVKKHHSTANVIAKKGLHVENPTYALSNLCEGTITKTDGEKEGYNSRLYPRLIDTVADENANKRFDSQSWPDCDSKGYVSMKECRGAGQDKTEYMTMTSNPANNKCDDIRACKPHGQSNTFDGKEG